MSTKKIDEITTRMNRITEELAKNVSISDDLLITSQELMETLGVPDQEAATREPQKDHKGMIGENKSITTPGDVISVGGCDLSCPRPMEEMTMIDSVNYANPTTLESNKIKPVAEIAGKILNMDSMLEDFQFMRARLRETTDISRKVLNSVTQELLYSDGESRAGLVVAFSELNKAQLEGIKLFMLSYKEVSTILANVAKLQVSSNSRDVYTTNVMNIEASALTSADIINRLRKID